MVETADSAHSLSGGAVIYYAFTIEGVVPWTFTLF